MSDKLPKIAKEDRRSWGNPQLAKQVAVDPPSLANSAMQKLVEEIDIEDVDPVLENIINKDCHFGILTPQPAS
jgi:hypothetical protein